MWTTRILTLVALVASTRAQQLIGGWNNEEPPICNGLNVSFSYTHSFGQSEYQYTITIDWGDSFSVFVENETLTDGETVTYEHSYAAPGTFVIAASAEVESLRAEVRMSSTK
jgi:hypothetical protein